MKKDFKSNAMKLGKTLTLCSKKSQELTLLKKKMMSEIIPYLEFSDYTYFENEDKINLDEYLKSLSVEEQSGDGFVFVDEMNRNIIVAWVISFIEKNGKINYSQFLKFSI